MSLKRQGDVGVKSRPMSGKSLLLRGNQERFFNRKSVPVARGDLSRDGRNRFLCDTEEIRSDKSIGNEGRVIVRQVCCGRYRCPGFTPAEDGDTVILP